ncbi:MAG: hypothetical protein A2428_08645 [Bdellovibrionales bacterium RIFOXYC1_FULL_54_43]|nr:MAG: hypothetical protein A2428_08645 [Bdellovibrionales bacterium RIFOXYC1_FULL_54_43]OFZ84284.1 MAG: hypothetical protein A2603_15225 [Bdellovibrionales bacterium RIFOXYD1_FULL_55_31]
MTRLYLALQFLPLAVFVAVARKNGFTPEAWSIAFQSSAIFAFIETVLLVIAKKPLNRLLMGANLFLAIGGIAFLLELDTVLAFYGQMMETTLFLAVVIVGLVSTFFTSRGFIEVADRQPQDIRRYSQYLLVITATCTVVSVIFRGNVLLAGTVPFVALIVARKLLQTKLQRRTVQ